MGVGRGAGRTLAPHWILKLIAKRGCFFNFEGQKTNFTTFGPPWKKNWENPLLTLLEKILPTPVVGSMVTGV